MCGIVGYIGPKNATPILLDGLSKLEYRGYDSVGVSLIDQEKLVYLKTKGRVATLKEQLKEKKLRGNLGIGHSRWATHGQPNEINAHPHFDGSKELALVHNGIIENYNSLKKWLKQQGHHFCSDTDTEVLPHLIKEYYRGNLLSAVQQALHLVEGAYGIALIFSKEPDKLIAARYGSPLVIGVVAKGEYIVASDPTAIIKHTKQVIYLEDGEIAVLTRQGMKIVTLDNVSINKTTQTIKWNLEEIAKSGFPHFMLKEIFEQPRTITNSLRGRLLIKEKDISLGGLRDWLDWIAKVKRIVITACGTSWHAGLVGEYLFENIVGLPTEVEYASEFRYKRIPIDPSVAYFVISQSGETADTLQSLRKITQGKGNVFGIVNTVGSTIARETTAGVYLHAGPEIGVASTKAFTSQVTVLALLTLALAKRRKTVSSKELASRMIALQKIPQQVESILKQHQKIKALAKKYYRYNNFLYLGRGYNFPVALEGALKLKEISYIHAEGYPAAEMKHGPISLIDQKMPVVVLATDTEDVIYQKVINNIEEIKARNGRIIAIATEGNKQITKLVDEVFYIPQTNGYLTPLLNVIPLQLLSYYIAVQRGCDVDKPRNLAKSVTVE